MEPTESLREVSARRSRLVDCLSDAVHPTQLRALALDRDGGFPSEDLDHIRALGGLAAPIPVALGGLGMGTEADATIGIAEVLRLIGRGSLSLGRLYEAHVNALRLVFRLGTAAQARIAAQDALSGRLFGLWVTDPPDAPLRLSPDLRLSGAKAPCSGAGHASRALVTACLASGESRLVLIRMPPGEAADLSGWEAHGMRAAGNGRITLDGISAAAESWIGEPGDYLREPDFSAGAWRGSAVALGGAEALVADLRRQLIARGRQADPHQLARVGEALIVQETARLWVFRAAQAAEAGQGDSGDIANIVNLARIATESACLDVIRIVRRALGMAAFRRGTLSELLFRDLAMYLRQPAPDETLTNAAAWFMQRDLPWLT